MKDQGGAPLGETTAGARYGETTTGNTKYNISVLKTYKRGDKCGQTVNAAQLVLKNVFFESD